MDYNRYDEYTPHVNGVIKYNGKPIKDHEVIFGINSEKINKEIVVITDEKGEFNFEAVLNEKDKSTESVFNEKRVSLYIVTEYDGERVILWNSTLSGFVVSDFERNNLGNLNCDVENPMTSFVFRDGEGNSAPVYVYSQCSLFGYFESEIIGN